MSSLLSTQTRWTPWLIAAALLGPSALSFGAEAVRLGILAESPEVATAADFLTAELSNEPGVGLVEREQISRVLKEQSLSASHGSDFVKLGEVLGADGLLFLEVVARGTNQVVSSRLAAVKPGVVLDLAEYAYPLPEPEQWSRMLARRMKPLFPKLGVLTKDAVPISFLNLRAAVKSADSEVLERRLSQVLVSRLAGQPEVFVLERQKLQALAQEKDLKGVGKEPFWNGSYLLEGIIDKGGFTKSSVTINVRLTPPRQGTPFDFELTGPREEAPSLTMAVAERVLARLKGQTRLQDWKASDEAERYFMEARWAWRWSMVPEALAAADSAWALGHNDQECGTIRVQAATSLAIHETPLEQQQHMLHSIFSPSAPRQPARIAELRDIEMAKRSLWNYDELRGLLAVGEIGMDSPVFVLGIQTLNEASKLLRTVYGNDELARDMEDPLAELRSGLRDVAGWLSKLPSVRAAYWPAGDAPIREGPVREALMMKQDLLSCELQYARLWFERPEDCLSLYREIMSSPGFAFLYDRIYLPNGLCGWTAQERERVPAVWTNFVQKLCVSTNVLLRIQGKLYAFSAMPGNPSMAVVDVGNAARDKELREQAAEGILAELLATNTVSAEGVLPYRIPPELASALVQPYPEIASEFQRRRDALPKAGSPQTNFGQRKTPAGAQPQTLTLNTNTRANAAMPLAHWPLSPGRQMFMTDDERAEALVTTARLHKIPMPGQKSGHASGAVRVAVEGHRVLANKVWFDERYGWGESWRGAAAVWDPNNARPVVSAATMTNGWQLIPYPEGDSSWSDAFSRGPDESVNGVHFELYKGALYLSVWHQSMRRYVTETGIWETLPIPISKPTQLFALGDHLFAANDDVIFEILDKGQRTQLLASTRRRPSASTLDSLPSLSTPILFQGAKSSLCAGVNDKVYRWENGDWAELVSFPQSTAPAGFDDSVIFRSREPPTASFWFLPKGASKPELYWQETWNRGPHAFGRFQSGSAQPLQRSRGVRSGPVLANAAVLSEGSRLYFLAGHLDRTGNPDGQADLIRIERGSWKPLLIPVQMPPGFQLRQDSGFQHRFPWMASIPGTLLIGQPGEKGVVTLPWKDVEAAFNAAKARQKAASE